MATRFDAFLETLRRFLAGLQTNPSAHDDTSVMIAGSGSSFLRVSALDRGAVIADSRSQEASTLNDTAPVPGPDAPFVVFVDDAGQYLFVPGARLVLGHIRGGRADLQFLADVGAEHALLERRESLRDGSVWSIAPIGRERVEVNGRPVTERSVLVSGDQVRLGENLRFAIRAPDPASSSLLMECGDGNECAGSSRLILFGEGEGGRVRISASEHRHIRVANLEHEITLVRAADRLQIRCERVVRTDGEGDVDEDGQGFSLPLPPRRRLELSIGTATARRPPFGIGIGPVEPIPRARER